MIEALPKLWPAATIEAAMVSGLVGNPLPPLGLDGDLQVGAPMTEAA
jgi:hypothetical protein